MATFKEHLTKAKSIKPTKIEDDVIAFVRGLEAELVEIQKDRIFNKSQDIFGNALGFYSKATEIISGGTKKEGEPFTGKDTGDFFRGFYMEEGGGVFNFYSSDDKTEAILNSEDWLSNELFGLTDEELKKVIREKILPFVVANARKQIGV